MSEDMTFEKNDPPSRSPTNMKRARRRSAEWKRGGRSLDFWKKIGLTRIEAYEREQTANTRALLQAIPSVRVPGDPADRISVLSFVAEGNNPSNLERALDRNGIAVRAGNLEVAPLLRALGER